MADHLRHCHTARAPRLEPVLDFEDRLVAVVEARGEALQWRCSHPAGSVSRKHPVSGMIVGP